MSMKRLIRARSRSSWSRGQVEQAAARRPAAPQLVASRQMALPGSESVYEIETGHYVIFQLKRVIDQGNPACWEGVQ